MRQGQAGKPTHEEIEKIVHQAFRSRCDELQNVIDELEDATTPKMKAQLTQHGKATLPTGTTR